VPRVYKYASEVNAIARCNGRRQDQDEKAAALELGANWAAACRQSRHTLNPVELTFSERCRLIRAPENKNLLKMTSSQKTAEQRNHLGNALRWQKLGNAVVDDM
jgi:hypothetical protein